MRKFWNFARFLKKNSIGKTESGKTIFRCLTVKIAFGIFLGTIAFWGKISFWKKLWTFFGVLPTWGYWGEVMGNPDDTDRYIHNIPTRMLMIECYIFVFTTWNISQFIVHFILVVPLERSGNGSASRPQQLVIAKLTLVWKRRLIPAPH